MRHPVWRFRQFPGYNTSMEGEAVLKYPFEGYLWPKSETFVLVEIDSPRNRCIRLREAGGTGAGGPLTPLVPLPYNRRER